MLSRVWEGSDGSRPLHAPLPWLPDTMSSQLPHRYRNGTVPARRPQQISEVEYYPADRESIYALHSRLSYIRIAGLPIARFSLFPVP